MEVVRERMLDHIHQVLFFLFFSVFCKTYILASFSPVVNVYCFFFQEIPYVIDHKLMGWKEFRDGSIRIEQHFITQKQSQRQILVGKKGSKIGYTLSLCLSLYVCIFKFSSLNYQNMKIRIQDGNIKRQFRKAVIKISLQIHYSRIS